MEAAAIDFQKLLREEKRKARQKKQQSEATEKKKLQDREKAEPKSSLPSSSPLVLPWTHHSEDTLHLTAASLDRFYTCICRNPPSVYYRSNYLSALHQERLIAWLQQLEEVVAAKDAAAAVGRWNVLPHAKRRVALFDESLLSTFPPPLQELVDALSITGVFMKPPNHILINEYQADNGIMPHTDGPAYESRTATISMGGSVLLQFTKQQQDSSQQAVVAATVLLEGTGSLVVFEGAAYEDHLHSIAEGIWTEHTDDTCINADPGIAVVRDYRISMTFRRKKNTTTDIIDDNNDDNESEEDLDSDETKDASCDETEDSLD